MSGARHNVATWRFLAVGVTALVLPLVASAQLNRGTPPELEGIDVTQNLGAQLPLHLKFVDDTGRDVRLGDYFDGKHPVLLTFNYYRCPMLCSLQLNGLVAAMYDMKWTAGQEFRVVTVGFDWLEGPDLARAKKANYIGALARPGAAAGWHFLTGQREPVRTLTDLVGFHFRWNEARQEWAHSSVLIVCSPTGVVSRYFGGLDFDPGVLRLSMVEASEGKVGSLWDRVFLTCFHYIPSDGKYVPFVMGIMRVAGAATVLLIVALLTGLMVMERRRRRRALSRGFNLPATT